MEGVVKRIKDTLVSACDVQSSALLTYLIIVYTILSDFKTEKEYLRKPHLITGFLQKINRESLDTNPSVNELLAQLAPLGIDDFQQSLNPHLNLDLKKTLGEAAAIDFSKEIIRGNYHILSEDFSLLQEELIESMGLYYAVYTPRPIIAILKGILKVGNHETFLDPCIGYGGLSTGVGAESKIIRGQDMVPMLSAISRINAIVANVPCNIKTGDSIANLDFDKSDVVAGHYPFGYGYSVFDDPSVEYMKWGLPSRNGGDFYFISLMLHHMKKRGATIVPEGILFRGGKEGNIRKSMIERNNPIEAVISLPPGVLKLTGKASSLIIFNREKANDEILMIDGTDFFERKRGGAVIGKEGIERIVEIYRFREQVKYTSRSVSLDELKRNDYILSVNRYIVLEIEEDSLDLISLENSLAELEREVEAARMETNDILRINFLQEF